MAQILVFPTRAALMAAAAARIGEALQAGIAARGAACAALSGGTSPEPAYRILATDALDWPRVTFALVDERFVPVKHADSNEGLLRRSLATALARGAQVAPMFSEAPTPADAAARADALYANLRFDFALMGMGADGHTASWFPGAAGLRDVLGLANPRSVVAVRAPRVAGTPERLSLTRSAIARAEHIAVLILGEEKRARLEAALAEPPETSPIAALFTLPACRPQVLWAP